MKRGQAFVRAIDKDGAWGTVDVLDLDDKSFKVFVLDMLVRSGIVVAIKEEMVEGEEITLYENK